MIGALASALFSYAAINESNITKKSKRQGEIHKKNFELIITSPASEWRSKVVTSTSKSKNVVLKEFEFELKHWTCPLPNGERCNIDVPAQSAK